MTRRDFELIADAMAELKNTSSRVWLNTVEELCIRFSCRYLEFDETKFRKRCFDGRGFDYDD